MISARESAQATSCLHYLQDAVSDGPVILFPREPPEDAFERCLVQRFPQPLNGVVRGDSPFAKDQNAGADLFEDIEDVRAAESCGLAPLVLQAGPGAPEPL